MPENISALLNRLKTNPFEGDRHKSAEKAKRAAVSTVYNNVDQVFGGGIGYSVYGYPVTQPSTATTNRFGTRVQRKYPTKYQGTWYYSFERFHCLSH